MNTNTNTNTNTVQQFYALTKPRVVQLIVFCALIGMCLAPPITPFWWTGFLTMLWGCLGIWLIASAAAAINCVTERQIDAKMKRTAWRPTAKGEISATATVVFGMILCLTGALILWLFVNTLTLWLTLATFVGYAIVYTVWLKPLTPQNIVIGGASGAMPPVLGWAAMTGEVSAPAWLMCLIIFLWTPPHFWSLALYRVEDYRKSGLPMLPVTHGLAYTRLQILLYTFLLAAACFLPFLIGMSGYLYLVVAVVLSIIFCYDAWVLYRLGQRDVAIEEHDAWARKTFRFSLIHLSCLFAALLLDHYVM